MSRSNNTEIKNPAKYFIEWSSKQKCFQYWSKEKEENVKIKLPFRFLVLDTLATIKGFSKADDSGFWANEIRDTKKDFLTVRTKKGECGTGLYADIITSKDLKGAKYSQSCYIAMKEPDGMVIANIQIHGASLGQWIDFRKKNNIYEGAIEVKTFIEGVNGDTTYYMPVFTKIAVTPEAEETAKQLDAELQQYLITYFKKEEERDIVDETPIISRANTEKIKEQDHTDLENPKLPEPEANEIDDSDDLPF